MEDRFSLQLPFLPPVMLRAVAGVTKDDLANWLRLGVFNAGVFARVNGRKARLYSVLEVIQARLITYLAPSIRLGYAGGLAQLPLVEQRIIAVATPESDGVLEIRPTPGLLYAQFLIARMGFFRQGEPLRPDDGFDARFYAGGNVCRATDPKVPAEGIPYWDVALVAGANLAQALVSEEPTLVVPIDSLAIEAANMVWEIAGSIPEALKEVADE